MSPPSFVAMIILTLFHLLSTRIDIMKGVPIPDSKNCVKENVGLIANDSIIQKLLKRNNRIGNKTL